MFQACEQQEDCRAAAEDLRRELKSFLSLAKRAPALLEQEESRSALIQATLLIAEVTNCTRNYYAKGIFRAFLCLYIILCMTNLPIGGLFSKKYNNAIDHFKTECEKQMKQFDRGVAVETNKATHTLGKLCNVIFAAFISSWTQDKIRSWTF